MTNQERLQQNNAKIEAIQQALANKAVTSGEIEITENNTYDVSQYASAKVNVPVPDLSQTTATADDVLQGKEFFNVSGEKVTGTYVDRLQWKCDNRKSFAWEFYQYTGESVDGALVGLNTNKVTSTYKMFSGCENLTSVPLFDTSNVTTMYEMFYGCKNLKTIPLFDTSKVTTMYGMFAGDQNASSYSSGLETLPLLDTSNVETMYNMFSMCKNLIEVPAFNTSKVTDMEYMFRRCSKLTTIPSFDTSNVTNMSEMFRDCYNLIEVPAFNTSKVTDMGGTFDSCSRLQAIPQLDTSNVTDMGRIFYCCQALETVPALDTKKVTTISNAFSQCYKLKTITLLDLRSIRYDSNQANIFANCRALENLTVKNITKTITIGSGTNYGHLLTLDSLLNTIQELWTNTGTSTLTLTMGTANTAKLANVYVKLIDITDEMRAEDEYIDNKAPFVVCESTDEGAMLITDYITTIKKWDIA